MMGRILSDSLMTASRYSSCDRCAAVIAAVPTTAVSSSRIRRSTSGSERDPLECPRECGAGRLVSRHQHHHELVPHLLVRQRRSVLIANLEEQRQDVLAISRVVRAPAGLNLAMDRGVVACLEPDDAPPGAPGGAACPRPVLQRSREKRRRRHSVVGEIGQRRDQLRALPVAGVDAEHSTDNCLKRHLPRLAVHRERDSRAPTCDGVRRDPMDQIEIHAHAIAVKLRQEQAPAIEMRRLVHREYRCVSGERTEHACVGFSCVDVFGRCGEQRFEKRRRPDEHPRMSPEQPQREDVAELPRALIEERQWIADVAVCLND